MKTLKQVRRYLDSVPCINLGGCGIAALAMYRWLMKNGRLTKKTGFVLVHSYRMDYAKNQNAIKGVYSDATACHHIALLHRGRIIDSEGAYVPETSKVLVTDDEQILIYALNNNLDDWNFMFDREEHVGNIEKALGIDLSDVSV